MFCANHSRSTNHHQTLHAGKTFHFLDQIIFRWQRNAICSTKRASASSGKAFTRPNELPPAAERHLLGQTGFRQLRNAIYSAKQASASSGKAFARPNATCATATITSSSSRGLSAAPSLPLAAPCLRTSAVKIAFFK